MPRVSDWVASVFWETICEKCGRLNWERILRPHASVAGADLNGGRLSWSVVASLGACAVFDGRCSARRRPEPPANFEVMNCPVAFGTFVSRVTTVICGREMGFTSQTLPHETLTKRNLRRPLGSGPLSDLRIQIARLQVRACQSESNRRKVQPWPQLRR